MATPNNADVSAVNLPDPQAKPKSEYDVSDLMKQSEFDELPLRPDPPATVNVDNTPPVEPPPAAPAPQTSFDHPRTMVRRAIALGASMADIKATPPAQLDEWIDANETIAAVEPKPDPVAPADPYGIEAMVKDNPDFDTPVVKVMRKIAETADARIAALEAENKSVKSQLAQAARSKSVDVIDEAFAVLAPTVFGAGNRSTLDANSAEAKRRIAVLQVANIKKTDSEVVIKQKIKATAETLFGVAPASPSPVDSNGHQRITPEQWNKAGLAPPTSRVVNEPEGVNKAYAAVRDLMAQKGMFADDSESAAGLRVPQS